MKDPKRLLAIPDALSEAEARALRAGKRLEPPSDAQLALWAALGTAAAATEATAAAASLGAATAAAEGATAAGAASTATLAGPAATGAAGAAGTVASCGTAGTAALSVVAKWVAIGTTASALVVGGGVAVEHARQRTDSAHVSTPPAREAESAALSRPRVGTRTPIAAQTAERVTPDAPERASLDGLAPRPAASGALEPLPPGFAGRTKSSASFPDDPGASPAGNHPAGTSPASNDAQSRESRVRQEARLVADARLALRAGNTSRATALLSELDRSFPDGLLRQEREALTIETLARTGQASLARERGERFLTAYPGSLHASRVHALLSTLGDRAGGR